MVHNKERVPTTRIVDEREFANWGEDKEEEGGITARNDAQSDGSGRMEVDGEGQERRYGGEHVEQLHVVDDGDGPKENRNDDQYRHTIDRREPLDVSRNINESNGL